MSKKLRESENFSRMNILAIKARYLRLLKTWSERNPIEIGGVFCGEDGGIYRITNDIIDEIIERVNDSSMEPEIFTYYLEGDRSLRSRVDSLSEAGKYVLQDKLKIYGLDLEFGQEPLGFEGNLSYRVTVL